MQLKAEFFLVFLCFSLSSFLSACLKQPKAKNTQVRQEIPLFKTGEQIQKTPEIAKDLPKISEAKAPKQKAHSQPVDTEDTETGYVEEKKSPQKKKHTDYVKPKHQTKAVKKQTTSKKNKKPMLSTYSSEFRGLYSYIWGATRISNTSPRVPEIQNSIKSKGISGVTLIDRWDLLEPSPGKFSWEKLDRWIRLAVRHKKNISIGVVGGASSPKWLMKAPFKAPYVNLSWDKTNGKGNNPSTDCTRAKIPLPWAPSYKHRYKLLMTALRDHLRSMRIPGHPPNAAILAVKMVKLGGINIRTIEAQLPMSGTHDLKKCRSDNTAKWRQAGYTPVKILSAWSQIAWHIGNTFPNRKLSLDVIAQNQAFPNIAPAQNSNQRKHHDILTQSLINAAKKMFRNRFIVQWDGLSTIHIPSMDELHELSQGGGGIAWQLNMRGQNNGSGCGINFSPCNRPGMRDLLEKGLKNDAEYLEVHSHDANRFSAEFFRPYDETLRKTEL